MTSYEIELDDEKIEVERIWDETCILGDGDNAHIEELPDGRLRYVSCECEEVFSGHDPDSELYAFYLQGWNEAWDHLTSEQKREAVDLCQNLAELFDSRARESGDLNRIGAYWELPGVKGSKE